MRKYICDACKMEIPDPRESVYTGVDPHSFEVCTSCGYPISDVLQSYNLIK